jgi:hypothetical protein
MKNDKRMVALFNKAESGRVRIVLESNLPIHHAEAWKLSAPSLDATSGVTLGGSEIRDDGSWHPKTECLPVHQNAVRIDLLGPSGMLVCLS